MASTPRALKRLTAAFLSLPGIGRRTAERFAYAMLEGRPETAAELASALQELHASVSTCDRCGQFSETSPCAICNDSQREQNLLCIVADSRTVTTLEQSGGYRGQYFVLGGLLNPIDGVTPAHLRTDTLVQRVGQDIEEVILALNATIEGDATALYLTTLLKPSHVRMTRLARGLPTGSRLEYADDATLMSAIKNRQST